MNESKESQNSRTDGRSSENAGQTRGDGTNIENSDQTASIPDPNAEHPEPEEGSGSAEEAFKAATRGTEEAPHDHPHRVEHSRESTGRHADDSWKKNR